MEDLTKHQLILLVLLVSFITSIGTGIITFTLLQEAPVEVTQNINRVVERTIEKVVPVEGQPEKVVTTVVVNEEDKILESISKNEKSIVRLKTTGAGGTEVFMGIGLVIDSSGTIVTSAENYTSGMNYSIFFNDGRKFSSGKIHFDSKNGLVFFKASLPQSEKYTFYPAVFGNSNILKIGQTLIAVNGRESNAVAIGRIRQLDLSEDKVTVLGILSDISSEKDYPGSPALNLSGEVVGLELPSTDGAKHQYIPSGVVKTAASAAVIELAK